MPIFTSIILARSSHNYVLREIYRGIHSKENRGIPNSKQIPNRRNHSATCARSPTSKGTCPDRSTARNPDITELKLRTRYSRERKDDVIFYF